MNNLDYSEEDVSSFEDFNDLLDDNNIQFNNNDGPTISHFDRSQVELPGTLFIVTFTPKFKPNLTRDEIFEYMKPKCYQLIVSKESNFPNVPGEVDFHYHVLMNLKEKVIVYFIFAFHFELF